MSKLLGIAVRAGKRAPMKMLESASVTLAKGVENDFRGKPGNRQVTVLSNRAWQMACDELKISLDWKTRRANLLVDDITLFQLAGHTIKIGDLKLLITRETDPCERMEESAVGLFKALAKDWRGGVCCRVICEGKINVGDEVEIYESNT